MKKRGRPSLNLKGRHYGKLTVLSKADTPPHINKRNKSQYWLCACSCGNQTIVSADKLRQHDTKSCGCLNQEQVIAMIGQKFGKLLVLERVSPPNHLSPNSQKQPYFLCQCDCSKFHIVSSNSLKSGSTKSCGCSIPTYTDPEQCRLSSAHQIYRTRYSDGDLSFDDFLFLTSLPCFYCNDPPAQVHNVFNVNRSSSPFSIQHGAYTYNGIDRISSSLPHLKSNCVPCCKFCNFIKNSDSLQEFYQRIIKIYHNAALPNKTSPPSKPS